jgi:hypothetical protein
VIGLNFSANQNSWFLVGLKFPVNIFPLDQSVSFNFSQQ